MLDVGLDYKFVCFQNRKIFISPLSSGKARGNLTLTYGCVHSALNHFYTFKLCQIEQHGSLGIGSMIYNGGCVLVKKLIVFKDNERLPAVIFSVFDLSIIAFV